MSAALPANNSTLSAIHPSQGVLTILSEAWNLVRLNLKDCFKTMLWPSLLFGLSSLAFSIPASLTFLTGTPVPKLIISIVCFLAGLLLWLTGMACWSFSYCVLSRLFYSAIVDEKPLSLQACWKHILQNWQSLILTLFLLLLISAGLIVLDLLVFYAGILISAAIFATLGVGNLLHSGQHILTLGMSILFLIVWGFMVLALLVILITGQSLVFTFPFVAIATRPSGPIQWWPCMQESFRLIFSDFPKLILFGITFFLFSCVLSAVLNAPVMLWVGLELSRLGVPTHHTIPMHIQVGLNFWGVLTYFVLLPFYSSAVTLMWYDCQVRKEGLDLKLWLRQLMQRRGFST
jgi:hypothetical protein